MQLTAIGLCYISKSTVSVSSSMFMTLHGPAHSWVSIDPETRVGRVVDFNHDRLSVMVFTVTSIEVNKKGCARVIYPLPIDACMLEEIDRCIFETELCQYGTAGTSVEVRSREKSGKTVCRVLGTLAAGERALVRDGSVWTGNGVWV